MTENTALRVTLVQQDIVWEDKDTNLNYMATVVAANASDTDVIVFPEMCTTGFSMNSHNLGESLSGNTLTRLRQWAREYDVALCGSFIAEEGEKYFNRGFFITPDKEYFYDKRHLFRMGREPEFFSPGNNRLIVEHKGFNICLLVCYDLRFPVWARNYDNAYDLLIYVANWPASRSKVWNTLLDARAIENMCYVCGVNRTGTDGNGLHYSGDSKMINARGETISTIGLNQSTYETVYISKAELNDFRSKFPVWKDADKFSLE